MEDSILWSLKKFLSLRSLKDSPLLVGFSGGPDSLCLFHGLLECRRFFPRLKLVVAHIDHGWREESGKEAAFLKDVVEKEGVAFYLHRLEGGCSGEQAAREARFSFFSEIYKKLGCGALVLGHQGDDQAETVLKRVLEGASLFSLGGIQEVSFQRGMEIWRPLLPHSKKEIYAWLANKGLQGLQDPTNRDARFLRSRMREELIPFLNEKFGKEVSSNLRYLGQSAQEWQEYLQRKVAPLFAAVQRGVDGLYIDLNPFYPIEDVELRVFLKKWAEGEGVFLSRDALYNLIKFIKNENLDNKIVSGSNSIEVKKRIVVIKPPRCY